MHSGQIRNLKIGLAVFVVVLSGATFAYFQYYNNRRVEALTGLRDGGAAPGAVRSARLEEIRRLRPTKPAAAVAVAEQIMAKPESDEERRAALADYPDLLAQAVSGELGDGRVPEALGFREKLTKRFPTASQAATARQAWGRHLGRTAEAALRKGDEAAAEAALTELFREPGNFGNAAAFQTCAQIRETKWRELLPTQPVEAMRQLAAAGRLIVSSEQLRKLAYAINSSATVNETELAAEAERWAATPQRHGALVLWWAQWLRLQSGRVVPGAPKLSEAERRAAIATVGQKLTTGLSEFGDRLRAGERPSFVLLDARAAYQMAVELLRDQPEEVAALVKLIEYETAEVEALAQPLLSRELGAMFALPAEEQNRLLEKAREVRSRTEKLFGDPGLRLWARVLQRPAFNPWPVVPKAWAESIERKAPEEERRRQLQLRYAQEPHRVPLSQLATARAVYFGNLARAGLLGTAQDTSEGHDTLRLVLRGTEDAEFHAALVGVLRQQIVDGATRQKFGQIYSLAGLYISEVGMPAADDPFRGQLRAALVKARDSFPVEVPMKRIFMDALLADGFADEEVGQKAREEAYTLAFADFPKSAPPPARGAGLASGIPGLSFARIENSTSHHLLVFYRGPEQFMVHSVPYRRGTASLQSGDYDLVVLCPDGAIQPYRGQVVARDTVLQSTYRIETNNRRGMAPSSLAGGAYTWLRRGPGAERLQLNAYTGTVALPAK
jgi:hypothetical protein